MGASIPVDIQDISQCFTRFTRCKKPEK